MTLMSQVRVVASLLFIVIGLAAQKPTDASAAAKDIAKKEAAFAAADREFVDATSILRASYDSIEVAVAKARGTSGAAWIADLSRLMEPLCASARDALGKSGAKDRIAALVKQQALPAIERIEDPELKLLLPWLRKRMEAVAAAPPVDASVFESQSMAALILNAPLGETKFHELWNTELAPVLPAAEALRKATATRESAEWDLAIARDPVMIHQRGAPTGFAKVPAGKYLILGNAGYGAQPPRAGRKSGSVAADVYIGLHEVSNESYHTWWLTLDEGGRKKHLPLDENRQGIWKGQSKAGDPEPSEEQWRQPVTGVLLSSAWAFAASRGARLPTEAEWCAAAGGKEGRLYAWGNDFAESRCRCSDGKAQGMAPVGSYPDGRGPFGHFDLGGNAAEWTSTYESSKDIAIAKIDDANAVVRGGSWLMTKADVGNGWVWYRRALYEQRADLGFRLAMDVPKASPR